IWDGLHDRLAPADLAVVLGNKVEQNGQPSWGLQTRLDKALQLYQNQTVKKILVSGGMGHEGFDEAEVMRLYLQARGVPAASIIADHQGDDTYLTAQHTRDLMRQEGLDSIVIVTHYYHIARTRLAMERFGIQKIYTAHADAFFELSNLLNIGREFLAFYYYWIRGYPQV
ncbi:MAG: YdcF family protein, partial [Anaerolineae bacterium]